MDTGDFKDRSTGLTVFGVLLILLGALCALMVPLMGVGLLVSRRSGAGVSPGAMVPALFFYALLAAAFLTLGIGSIRARRWARALILTQAWIWLVSGSVALLFLLLLIPDMYAGMVDRGQMTAAVAATIKTVLFSFLAVIYIVIPGALVLFYGQAAVKATCEARNPEPCWTDRCPLPVLAVSLLCAFGGVGMMASIPMRAPLPCFGTLVTGMPGMLMTGAVAVLFLLLAWGLYRVRIEAWWTLLAGIALGGASAFLTFSRVGMMAFYEAMNYPPEQIAQMKEFGAMFEGPRLLLAIGLSMAVYFVYLLCIHRYFRTGSQAP